VWLEATFVGESRDESGMDPQHGPRTSTKNLVRVFDECNGLLEYGVEVLASLCFDTEVPRRFVDDEEVRSTDAMKVFDCLDSLILSVEMEMVVEDGCPEVLHTRSLVSQGKNPSGIDGGRTLKYEKETR
jgi:hypothetical protein